MDRIGVAFSHRFLPCRLLDGSPAAAYPLGLCEGDCDTDSECLPGLICYQRDSFQAVPGCIGGEGDSSKTDYCTYAPGGSPTPQVTPRPTLKPTSKPINFPSPAPQAMAFVEFMGNGKAALFPVCVCVCVYARVSMTIRCLHNFFYLFSPFRWLPC